MQAYYDLDSASEVLPWVKERLEQLWRLKRNVEEILLSGDKNAISLYASEIDRILKEITEKGIVVRDLDRGLLDFPAIINDSPAYLCWVYGEPQVMYWHYSHEGFAGRKMLTGRERMLSYR